jgi:23S rRNA (cytidine1920-2'-O)/16S rRNA (cytidine1409-2'-O)-methyltransferase
MKSRLDQVLLMRGVVNSIEVAQSLIIRGEVLVDDRPMTKPGSKLDPNSNIRLRSEPSRYVSRGGEKLHGALAHFGVDLTGKIVLDIGASTGGFSDCVLQHGAELVYAVDVGHSQLHQKLRADPRVRVCEQLHAKHLLPEQFIPKPDFAVVDVSFIAVRTILETVWQVLTPNWEMMILVKPQFELEREYIEKGGVVKDKNHQLLAVSKVKDFLSEHSFYSSEPFSSPLTGEKKGNQEYFLLVNNKKMNQF